MRRRPVPVLPVDELQSWTTKRLLGRLHALRILEESAELSDMTPAETADWSSRGIGFKSEAAWSEAYQDLKRILDDQEHIPR
ncbi:MAG: hypothetical protein AAGG50_07835 [Bacteroidota bacterium]